MTHRALAPGRTQVARRGCGCRAAQRPRGAGRRRPGSSMTTSSRHGRILRARRRAARRWTVPRGPEARCGLSAAARARPHAAQLPAQCGPRAARRRCTAAGSRVEPWIDIRCHGHTLGHYLTACACMYESTARRALRRTRRLHRGGAGRLASRRPAAGSPRFRTASHRSPTVSPASPSPACPGTPRTRCSPGCAMPTRSRQRARARGADEVRGLDRCRLRGRAGGALPENARPRARRHE